jgi:hypothetical protein
MKKRLASSSTILSSKGSTAGSFRRRAAFISLGTRALAASNMSNCPGSATQAPNRRSAEATRGEIAAKATAHDGDAVGVNLGPLQGEVPNGRLDGGFVAGGSPDQLHEPEVAVPGDEPRVDVAQKHSSLRAPSPCWQLPRSSQRR